MIYIGSHLTIWGLSLLVTYLLVRRCWDKATGRVLGPREKELTPIKLVMGLHLSGFIALSNVVQMIVPIADVLRLDASQTEITYTMLALRLPVLLIMTHWLAYCKRCKWGWVAAWTAFCFGIGGVVSWLATT